MTWQIDSDYSNVFRVSVAGLGEYIDLLRCGFQKAVDPEDVKAALRDQDFCNRPSDLTNSMSSEDDVRRIAFLMHQGVSIRHWRSPIMLHGTNLQDSLTIDVHQGVHRLAAAFIAEKPSYIELCTNVTKTQIDQHFPEMEAEEISNKSCLRFRNFSGSIANRKVRAEKLEFSGYQRSAFSL